MLRRRRLGLLRRAARLGMAAGAFAAGLAITSIGYPTTFLLTAAAMVPAFALIRRPTPHETREARVRVRPRGTRRSAAGR